MTLPPFPYPASPGVFSPHFDDSWFWISIVLGLVVGVVEALILRWATLLKRAIRNSSTDAKSVRTLIFDRIASVHFFVGSAEMPNVLPCAWHERRHETCLRRRRNDARANVIRLAAR